MQLTTRAVQGMPVEAEVASVPPLTPDDASRYDGYFVLLDAGGSGLVGRAQAEPLFERAALPADDVDRIWALADVDRDGRLTRGEFRVAMHLATCAYRLRLHAHLP